MSPQAELAKEIAGIVQRNIDATDPSMLVRNVIPLNHNEAVLLVGLLKAVASAESFTEQKVYEALYPDAKVYSAGVSAIKPVSDFLGIYTAKLEASSGRTMQDDEIAFDYTTRADSDPRQKLTVGQVRRFIEHTK